MLLILVAKKANLRAGGLFSEGDTKEP
jgi:hypothetical protein